LYINILLEYFLIEHFTWICIYSDFCILFLSVYIIYMYFHLRLLVNHIGVMVRELASSVIEDTNGEFRTSLEKSPLAFSFQDGRIEELCTSRPEKTWVLNIKRGILSSIQNNHLSIYQVCLSWSLIIMKTFNISLTFHYIWLDYNIQCVCLFFLFFLFFYQIRIITYYKTQDMKFIWSCT
jgi:hypothetical protein